MVVLARLWQRSKKHALAKGGLKRNSAAPHPTSTEDSVALPNPCISEWSGSSQNTLTREANTDHVRCRRPTADGDFQMQVAALKTQATAGPGPFPMTYISTPRKGLTQHPPALCGLCGTSWRRSSYAKRSFGMLAAVPVSNKDHRGLNPRRIWSGPSRSVAVTAAIMRHDGLANRLV